MAGNRLTDSTISFRWVIALFCGGVLCSMISSCSESNTANQDIKISWELIENAHEGNMQFLSELNIVNNGASQLGNNWELFFSFSPCRALSFGEDNQDLEVEHIEGDYHRIQPSSSFTGLKGGDSLSLKLLITGASSLSRKLVCFFWYNVIAITLRPYKPCRRRWGLSLSGWLLF